MAGYISDAKKQAEKIEYYYQFAGSSGYNQAMYHWDKLVSLVFSAKNSKKYKGEELVIYDIMLSMQKLMDEMKLRKKDI